MTEQSNPSQTLEPITGGTRSNVVDIVKGIAIILVVYGHTAQGLAHRGWWTGPAAEFSDAFVYSFHMPAFFFVSGLFVLGSIQRRGPAKFTLEKIKTILYPYLLVSVIYTALAPFMKSFQVSYRPFELRTFLTSVADGSVSWFLFTLFFCLMLALLTAWMPAWLRFTIAAFIGIMQIVGPPPLTYQLLHEFCFVAAGMWVGKHIYRLDRIPKNAAAIGLLVLTLFQVVFIYRFGAANRWNYIGLGLTGTSALLLLARLIDKRRIGEVMVWVGRASLAIFLLSAFAQGAVRVALANGLHIRNVPLQLLLPTIVATLLPTILWHRQDKWHLGWLFHWPF